MNAPLVVPDPRVFALTAVHHDPGAYGLPFGVTEWYEDAVTAAGRIPEGESLDRLADRAMLDMLRSQCRG